MSLEIAATLLILLAALILFVTEWVRADVVALLVTLALLVTGLVSVDEAFAGFASPAVVTVWAVFIISGGLQRTGVADMLARRILRLAGADERRLLLVLMVGAGLMSAFMNNVGAVAILMPAVISIGRTRGIAPSKLLMPLAFAALLGGNITLIGTPPNILAVSLMQERGLDPFSFFDFAPTGLIVLGVGIAYMLLVGRRLLPDRSAPGGLAAEYPVRPFLGELAITAESSLAGKTIGDSELYDRYALTILRVERLDEGILSPHRQLRLLEGDQLLLEGTPEALLHLQTAEQLRPVAGFSADQWHPEENPDDLHLAEVTMAPNSRLENQTLGELNFRERYGLSVLAVRHHGTESAANLRDTRIQFGDSLLVQGPTRTLDNLINEPNLLVLERPSIELRRTTKAPLAIAILIGVLAIAATGWLHVAGVMLAGALLIVLTGVLTMDEAYRAIDWKAVFLIAGMLPLGTAMEQTGTAPLLAVQLTTLVGALGPLVLLGALFLLTALLTELISNAAATVLLVPVAIDMALQLNLAPEPFVMATVLAASTSFLMPVGHQVNVIIFGAGNYRFGDYARVGVGLNLLMLATALLIVPWIWPF